MKQRTIHWSTKAQLAEIIAALEADGYHNVGSQSGRNYQKMVISTVFLYITGCKSVEFVQFVVRVYPVWDCFWD